MTENGTRVLTYYRNKKTETKLQTLNSVTKSFMSALIGIAIERGDLPGVQTRLVEFFPELARDADPRKQALTVEHLLSMSAGFDWPEFGEWNYWTPMFFSTNWVRYVLERPLKDEPGARMNYNTGCSQVLTALLQRATGTHAAKYAEQHLFGPLGIREYRWHEDPQGVPAGGNGLRLLSQDMEKFGIAFLAGGAGVVNADWVRTATTPRYLAYENIGRYGYHWWVDREQQFYFALGFGGQYIIVVPDRQMVITITSELYSDSLLPLRLVREHLLGGQV